MTGGPPVLARGLAKHYGTRVAVAGLDLTVEPGDVYGYLGPNGAGKTTSLRMMLGLVRPTAGSVHLFGRDPQAVGVRALEGVAGFVETPRFYPYLTGRASLEMLADLDGGDARMRIDPALDLVGLADRARDRVGGYSQGMRQRLGIAGALLRAPRLLLLDEPTNGLDPPGIRDVRELVRRLAADGMTVMLSSHLMAEVEAVCTRVAILNEGVVAYEGTIAELRGRSGVRRRLRASDPARALGVCASLRGLCDVAADGADVVFRADDDAALLPLTAALAGAGVSVLALTGEAPGLEDLFFRLTEGDGARAIPAAIPRPAVAGALA